MNFLLPIHFNCIATLYSMICIFFKSPLLLTTYIFISFYFLSISCPRCSSRQYIILALLLFLCTSYPWFLFFIIFNKFYLSSYKLLHILSIWILLSIVFCCMQFIYCLCFVLCLPGVSSIPLFNVFYCSYFFCFLESPVLAAAPDITTYWKHLSHELLLYYFLIFINSFHFL